MIGKAQNGPPVVKLLDLGIAKLREIAGAENSGNTALTMAGQVLGTPYYMSPEQWGEIPRDGNIEIDGRADIYSLGLVFYEMIIGRRCFSGHTLHELRREHVATMPKPLREVAPDVPPAFSAAIERATAKDRADRQASAAVLANELRAALASAPAPQQNAGPTPEVSETVAIRPEVGTKSDVNAPTMITMEGAAPTAIQADRSASTNAATVFEPAATPPPPMPAPPKPQPNMPAATIAESAPMPSVVTVPQIPKGTGEIPQVVPPAKSKSKAGLFIVAAVLVVLLLGGGVAGFLIWNSSRSKTTLATTGPSNNPGGTTAVEPREITNYWLELAPDTAKPVRVAAMVPISSGQKFRFHFVFTENGYVYIFGPGGEHNQPMAFLTTKPLPATGVKSNQVVQGEDFSFPRGDSMELDTNPGTDNFTVIFSKTALPAPSFLNEPVTGEPLSAQQQAELKAFVTKYQQKSTVTELDESTAGASSVRVKVPPDQTGNPIVFDIRIQHN